MPLQRLRRALLTLACLSGALLAGCGGGEVASQFTPRRVVSFGDAFTDLGQNGSRYTINGDDLVNHWLIQMASRYGLSVNAAVSGGNGYATGSARITTKPDAGGSSATPTVVEQVDGYLAGGGSFGADDLVVIGAGIADLVAEVGQTRGGAQSESQAAADITQAGKDLGTLVRRVVQAGGQHVVVVGPYNMGRTPWARGTGQSALLQDYSTRFNDALLISIADLGAKVLYVDAALYYNLVVGSPSAYGFANATEAACTSVDPGPGIGIGDGQVNSALCTTATLRSGIDRNTWLYADAVYPTSAGHRAFGNYAFDRIRARW